VNFQRPRWGEWIAAIAGAELLLVTFRSWYKVDGTNVQVAAWDALEQGRYLLLIAGLVGILLLLATAAGREAESSVHLGAVTGVVGLACAGYIGYRLSSPPNDNATTAAGAYLGLAAALGIAIGGYQSAKEPIQEGLSPALDGDGPQPEGGETEWAAGATGPEQAGTVGGGTWSPAAPAASGSWSPAAPVAETETTELPLSPGDQVALTAGGSRWPSGTVARVVQVFAGGALVEVAAPDGATERFEVPEEAFERVGAGSTPGFGGAAGFTAPADLSGGADWSPGMPSAAGTEDWGIGDGAAVADEDVAGTEKKPGFFKRLFGGGKKKRDAGADGDGADEIVTGPDGDLLPESPIAGFGTAAESDTAINEGVTSAFDEPAVSSREPDVAVDRPDDEVWARDVEVTVDEPDVTVDEPAPEDEDAGVGDLGAADAPLPAIVDEPDAGDEGPAVVLDAPPVDDAPADEPVAATPVEEPPVIEPPVEVPPVEEPPVEEPPVEVPADEPPAAEEPPPDEPAAEEAEAATPKPAAKKRAPRKKSSGSRKVPQKAVEAAEAAAAAGDAPPSVGDEVELKVAGGGWDAGTKGTVVDVFSAGVIVELSDDDGRTERLDLPFEAVGPSQAGS
jgi:hypothetical protein